MDPVSKRLLSPGRFPVFTKYTCIRYGSKVEAGSHVLMLPEPASAEPAPGIRDGICWFREC